jgi:hypothetical protein
VADNLVTISAVENTVITAPPKATRAAVSDVVTVSAVTHSVVINGIRGGASTNLACITTDRMPIIDRVCILPSRPLGNFIFNQAYIYMPYGTDGDFCVEIYSDIALDKIGDNYVMKIMDTSSDFTGCFAVVSYVGALT